MAITALNNCKNKKESYGEICVRCNLCGRYDKDKMKTNERLTYKSSGRYFCDYETREIINRLGECEDKLEQIQTDYEARLKADMVAMLTEIQLEIEEKAIELCDDGWWLTYNNLIREKINAIEENIDDE